jgi:hypothetical protein
MAVPDQGPAGDDLSSVLLHPTSPFSRERKGWCWCEARARPYDRCGSLLYLDDDFIHAALRQINRRADAGRRYCQAMARPAINTEVNGTLDGTSGAQRHCRAPRYRGPREKCQMNRFLLIAAAALCVLTIMPTLPAAAMPMTPLAPVAAQTGVDTVLVRGGHGHGHGHMGRGGRGHHYGWGRGRGHHHHH